MVEVPKDREKRPECNDACLFLEFKVGGNRLEWGILEGLGMWGVLGSGNSY